MLFSIILLIFQTVPISTVKNNNRHIDKEMIYSIDTSIHPCDDFYAFACNKWIKDNPLPNGRDEWTQFDKLTQRNELIIKTILERAMISFKSEAEKKAKLYYQSCVDESTVEKLGSQPLRKLIQQIGGWNASPSGFNVSNWSLFKIMKTIHNKYDVNGLFVWGIDEDPQNSTRRLIHVDQGGLTFGRPEIYTNKSEYSVALSAFLIHMTKLVVLLGGNEKSARRKMNDIIDFETRLAEITEPPEERQDLEKLYHLMTVGELQEHAPFINWRGHFKDAFRLVKRKVTKKDLVVVIAPEYLKKLTKIINEYQSTENGKIILNNYLVWCTVSKFGTYLSKDFQDTFDELKHVTFYYKSERWRKCVSETEIAFIPPITAMFIREVFNGDEKKLAEQMINEVRTAFQQNFRLLEWMDEETQILANEKVAAMSNMIGYPDYILNHTIWDKQYNELVIDPTKYFENKIQIIKYDVKNNLELLDELVDRRQWEITQADDYATHSYTANTISVSAKILQRPFFDVRNPKSLNFGAMGHIMGHEITHAFDNNGRKFDKFGNLRQWWNKKTIDRFEKHANCFVKQYEKYQVNGMNLNGKQTLNENIADNAGLRAAFNAFKKSWNKSDADMMPVSGINMTQGQTFFVAFAQFSCASETEDLIHFYIDTDSHSPRKFRVNGPLSNLPEFSKEFHCSLESPMNPRKKCNIL